MGKNEGEVAKCYSAVDITLSCDVYLKSSCVAGFCGNNEDTIEYSVYCGHFNASDFATYVKAFTYTVYGGSTDNTYYVQDWITFNTSSNGGSALLSGSLNKSFFIALEFWDNVWVYDNDNALPHF